MIHLKTDNGEITEELISPFWRQKTERQHWIDKCVELTGKKYVMIASMFRSLPTEFIKDLYLKAQETNSSKVKYFWSIWRDSKAK